MTDFQRGRTALPGGYSTFLERSRSRDQTFYNRGEEYGRKRQDTLPSPEKEMMSSGGGKGGGGRGWNGRGDFNSSSYSGGN